MSVQIKKKKKQIRPKIIQPLISSSKTPNRIHWVGDFLYLSQQKVCAKLCKVATEGHTFLMRHARKLPPFALRNAGWTTAEIFAKTVQNFIEDACTQLVFHGNDLRANFKRFLKIHRFFLLKTRLGICSMHSPQIPCTILWSAPRWSWCSSWGIPSLPKSTFSLIKLLWIEL